MPAIATSCTALPEFPPCEQVVIIVFPNVDIPPGSSIASADILFDVDEVRPGQSDADTTIVICKCTSFGALLSSSAGF